MTKPIPENPKGRRDQMRERVLEAAEAVISTKGLAGLKARDIAARAACALGAIYTVFEDLDGKRFSALINALWPGSKLLWPRQTGRTAKPSYSGSPAPISAMRETRSRVGGRCSSIVCRPKSRFRTGTRGIATACSVSPKRRSSPCCRMKSRMLENFSRPHAVFSGAWRGPSGPRRETRADLLGNARGAVE